MNKIKLLGVIAILGSSMLFSTPAQAKYTAFTCVDGEMYIQIHYTILGINVYTSEAPIDQPC